MKPTGKAYKVLALIQYKLNQQTAASSNWHLAYRSQSSRQLMVLWHAGLLWGPVLQRTAFESHSLCANLYRSIVDGLLDRKWSLGTFSSAFSFIFCVRICNMMCDAFIEGLLILQHSEVKICRFSQQTDINLLIFCRY